MEKRGESTLYFLFTTLLPLFVLVIFMTVAVRTGNNEVFIQQNVADDLALAVETVESAPGDVHYTVQRAVNEYIIDINDGRVLVSDGPTDASGKAATTTSSRSSHYVPRTSRDFSALLSNANKVVLATSSSTFTIEHDGVALA